jgi:hypothetical protein
MFRNTFGRLTICGALVLALGVAAAAPAWGHQHGVRSSVAHRAKLRVSPNQTRAGGRLRVSGTVAGGCARGEIVTLLSRAFVRTHVFAGVAAVYAVVGRGGSFSVKTNVPTSRRAGRYAITGRCGGGNLGASAHLRVRRALSSAAPSSYTLQSSTVSVPVNPLKYPTLNGLCASGYHVAGSWQDDFEHPNYNTFIPSVDPSGDYIWVTNQDPTNQSGNDPQGRPYYQGLSVTLGNHSYLSSHDGYFTWTCDPD